MTFPILDLAVFGSSIAVLLLHFEACDASTQQSKDSSFGLMMSPLSFAPRRYLPIHFTASACLALGAVENLAHWCTAHAMSGLVDFLKHTSFFNYLSIVKCLVVKIFIFFMNTKNNC